jgi:hypothetical protein
VLCPQCGNPETKLVGCVIAHCLCVRPLMCPTPLSHFCLCVFCTLDASLLFAGVC